MGEAARIEETQGPSAGSAMSAVLGPAESRPPGERPEPRIVEVRRNALLAGVVGVVAAAVAIAYLGRATTTGAVTDWALTGVTAVFAVAWLWSLVDARTPLLVADAHGVRVRLGRTWEGLPWRGLERLEHHPRRGLGRDGRLVLVPEPTPGAATPLVDGLDATGRRHAAISRRLHGAPLAVPLGLATRLAGVRSDEVVEVLRALAGSDARVVEVAQRPAEAEAPEQPAEAEVEAGVEDPARRRTSDPRPALARLIGSLARPARSDRPEDTEIQTETETETESETEDVGPEPASETPEPQRERRAASRAEVQHAARERTSRGVLPEAEELRRDGDRGSGFELVEDTEVWGARVRPIARSGDSVEPLVLDDFSVEPASDPLIGPELAAARTRLSLSVDQLADRTRIRPHVLESIEVDDFAPCGGDFYARGHLRTLARVLGVDAQPLLAAYDARYADAPIDPRRVFAAELATGANGSIRGTRGGPSWSVLVAAVMVIVLAWSVARLVMDEPVDLQPAPALNGSAGPAGAAPAADPVPLVVRAVEGGASVTVRDGTGEVRFSGDLAMGESTELELSPPVRIEASDGGAVQTVLDGRDNGRLGEVGQPASDTLVPR